MAIVFCLHLFTGFNGPSLDSKHFELIKSFDPKPNESNWFLAKWIDPLQQRNGRLLKHKTVSLKHIQFGGQENFSKKLEFSE